MTIAKWLCLGSARDDPDDDMEGRDRDSGVLTTHPQTARGWRGLSAVSLMRVGMWVHYQPVDVDIPK